jgi:hypothetical protein
VPAQLTQKFSLTFPSHHGDTYETKHIDKRRQRRYHETIPSSVGFIDQRIDGVTGQQRDCHIRNIAERQLVISVRQVNFTDSKNSDFRKPYSCVFFSSSLRTCLSAHGRYQYILKAGDGRTHTFDVKLVWKKRPSWRCNNSDIHSFGDLCLTLESSRQ